jgi:hypothetical protein
MDPKYIKNLFIDFFGEEIKIYGLFVHLADVSYVGKTEVCLFQFELHNPNDISYYSTPFKWEIDEMLMEFKKYVDIKFKFNLTFVDNYESLYFNKQKKQEIESSFKSVNSIEFSNGGPLDGYTRYSMDIRSIGFKKYHDDNEIYLQNIIKVVSATKNGDPCSIEEATKEYYDVFLPKEETYWESEHLFYLLDEVLSSIPALSDNEIVFEYGTKLFN